MSRHLKSRKWRKVNQLGLQPKDDLFPNYSQMRIMVEKYSSIGCTTDQGQYWHECVRQAPYKEIGAYRFVKNVINSPTAPIFLF